jgi:DNA replication initiation complex subunit (GINS family)
MDPLQHRAETAAAAVDRSLAALRSRLSRLILAPAAEDAPEVAEGLGALAAQITVWMRESKQILATARAACSASSASTTSSPDGLETQASASQQAESIRHHRALSEAAKILRLRADVLNATLGRLIEHPIDAAATKALSKSLAAAERALASLQAQMHQPVDASIHPWSIGQASAADSPPDTQPDHESLQATGAPAGCSAELQTPPSEPQASEADPAAAARRSTKQRAPRAARTADTSALARAQRHQVELHRLDDAERAWWHREFLRVRRQLTLAWSLALSGIAVILMATLQHPPQDAPVPLMDATDDSPRVAGLSDRTAATERRLAEMELEMIRLRAELSVAARPTPETPRTPETSDAAAGEINPPPGPAEADAVRDQLPLKSGIEATLLEPMRDQPNRAEPIATDAPGVGEGSAPRGRAQIGVETEGREDQGSAATPDSGDQVTLGSDEDVRGLKARD